MSDQTRSKRPRTREELEEYLAEQEAVRRLVDIDGFHTRSDAAFSAYSRSRIDEARQRILEDSTINTSELMSDPLARRTFPSHPKRIVITPIAAKVISDEIANRSDVETGGCLRGRFTDGGVIVAAATVYTDPMTERAPGYLRFSQLEVYETPDCVGTWHSHLHSPSVELSPEDIAVAASELADFDEPQQVSLVVAAEGTIALHRRRFTWTAFLFTRDRSGEVTFETLAGT